MILPHRPSGAAILHFTGPQSFSWTCHHFDVTMVQNNTCLPGRWRYLQVFRFPVGFKCIVESQDTASLVLEGFAG
jgi:hypothetical protein